MPIDPQKKLTKEPEYTQSNQLTGAMKAVVVDVRDPLMQGRVRCHVFPINGPYNDLNLEALKWAEPKHGSANSFAPPQVGQRVWLSFDAGQKYNPTYEAAWYGIPTGKGKLPFDHPTGTEIRPEAWSSNNLYPEVTLVASSPEGNAIWIEHHNYAGSNAHDALNLMDTGGKSIRIWSFHAGQSPWSQQQDWGASLEGVTIPDSVPTRDGVTPITEESPGGIELSTINVTRTMQTDESGFSSDAVLQYDDNQDLTLESMNIAGEIHRTRAGGGALSMFNDAAFLTSLAAAFIPNLHTVPRRYDQ